MALDVKVKIDINKPIGKLGYSYPLMLVVESDKSPTINDYKECKTLDEVVKAGYATTTNAYKTANLIFSQNNAPTKIAIKNCKSTEEVTTITDCTKYNWRQLIVVCEGSTTAPTTTVMKSISDYIETTEKMYFCSVSATTGTSTFTKTNARTVVFMYSGTAVCPEAALVGASAGLTVGSFTYKNLILNGITPLELTDTQIEAAHTAGAITFVAKAGDNVTTEGKALNGEYIDIIDSKDFVIQNIEYKLQKVFNTTNKVPYDNNGIAMLESAVIEVMRDAYNNGIIATNEDGTPAYSVSFALRSATTDADRKARKYPYGRFSFVLAGAIHEAEITGEITI